MENRVPVSTFLDIAKQSVVLDVRSPGEYEQGHIPGAVSFPLFTDEERAEVGTCYKQVGPEQALELGLRIVGPKMADFVVEAKRFAPNKKILVHCWRGGQRSGSVAWLLRQAGFEVKTLEGGYKAYRTAVLARLSGSVGVNLSRPDTTSTQTSLPLVVLGGRTGSGKTKILHELANLGEQILDLEGIAHHKGSAFGFIGEPPQPTAEQFENQLFTAIQALDTTRPIWVENESRSIGRVYLPNGLWANMKVSPLVVIDIPEAARIAHLVEDYVHTNPEDLNLAFHKISSKLGGLQLKNALDALHNKDFAEAARIALHYYDKTYQHGLSNSVAKEIRHFSFDYGDPHRIAAYLQENYG